MFIGEELILEWNTAKTLGDEMASGTPVRVEAFGKDWIVLRDTHRGKAYSATFSTHRAMFDFYKALERYEG